MNAKTWTRLEKLAEKCAAALRDPHRQSEHVWRGDMWAIIGAHHDLRKVREKARTAPAVERPVESGKDDHARQKALSSSPHGQTASERE